MHEAAKLKPVVIDESLIDYESLLLSRELGYSGVALKACKGTYGRALAGGGRAEIRYVPVRAGPDVSRFFIPAFREPGSPNSNRGRHRRERATVLPRPEPSLESPFSRASST